MLPRANTELEGTIYNLRAKVMCFKPNLCIFVQIHFPEQYVESLFQI